MLVILTGCGASVREGWSPELCEAADGIMESEREAPESDLDGILVLKSGFFNDAYKVQIVAVNPKNGKSELLTEFRCEIGQGIMAPVGSFANLRDAFTSDFSKMAITFYRDGLPHAGWMNSDGNITDVTETIGLEYYQDGTGLAGYRAYGFRDDQTFAYSDSTGRVFMIPVDDLRFEAISEADADDTYVYFWDNIYNGSQTWSETVQRAMRPTMVIDDRYVLSDYHRQSEPGTSIVITTPELAIPINSSGPVVCWSAILSPDNKQIGFLSREEASGKITMNVLSLKTGKVQSIEVGDLLKENCDNAGEPVMYRVLDWR